MSFHKSFTLIELLIVVAIIGVLAGILFVSIGQGPLQKSRDARRKDGLKQLQLALELYASDNNGNYPNNGWRWCSSEAGDASGCALDGGDYIPGISPTYMSALPRDPLGGTAPCGWKRAYLYLSDGKTYKLLAHCGPETGFFSSDPFYDPIRPTWAWMVCGPLNPNNPQGVPNPCTQW